MAATTKTAPPTDADIAEGFNTIEVKHKGKTYTFRELSAEEYDACVEVSAATERATTRTSTPCSSCAG